MNELDQKDRQFIQERKNIEWSYARPYMPPSPNPAHETEVELRERVREGLEYLTEEERTDMKKDIRRVYYDIFSPSCSSPPISAHDHV